VWISVVRSQVLPEDREGEASNPEAQVRGRVRSECEAGRAYLITGLGGRGSSVEEPGSAYRDMQVGRWLRSQVSRASDGFRNNGERRPSGREAKG
jgi:hypothetical protein